MYKFKQKMHIWTKQKNHHLNAGLNINVIAKLTRSTRLQRYLGELSRFSSCCKYILSKN